VEAKGQLRSLLQDFGERGQNNKDKVLRCCNVSELGRNLNNVLRLIERALGAEEFTPEDAMLLVCTADYSDGTAHPGDFYGWYDGRRHQGGEK
tara:strand:- start:400 stop:678 length:279 start_codon:yes stop_codon:yes gene_type:complete